MTKGKYTEEFVKNYLAEFGYELIGDYGGNVMSKLQAKCNNGHLIENSNFRNVLSGKRCRKCFNEGLKYSKEYINDFLDKEGYKLIGEYMGVDNKSMLECHKGHQISVRMGNFKSGRRCGVCNKINGNGTKYTEEFVKNYLKDYEYELLKYSKSYLPMLVKCPKGHIIDTLKFSFFKRGNRCRKCRYEKMSNNRISKYKNKKIEKAFKMYLRKKIKETNWFKNSFANAKYRCAITGDNKNLEIHHIKNFKIILEETLNELCLNKDEKIYLKDLYRIKNLFFKKHEEQELGIVLRRDLHRLFHSFYGNRNNTKEQLDEFIFKVKSGEIPIDI